MVLNVAEAMQHSKLGRIDLVCISPALSPVAGACECPRDPPVLQQGSSKPAQRRRGYPTNVLQDPDIAEAHILSPPGIPDTMKAGYEAACW